MGGARGMFSVLGLLMMLIGGVWILQGLNVSWAPQSFMTSDINWTYRGIGFASVGLVLVGLTLLSGWRDVLGGVGAFAAFIGALLAAQAFNVLPGMAMSGNMDWAVRGGIAIIVGVVLIFIASHKTKEAGPPMGESAGSPAK